MGKRELVIIAAFVAIGVAVYRLAVPPAEDTNRGFSLSKLGETWRRRVAPASGHATVTTTGTLPASPALAELRVSNLATVDIRGEDRDDIAWTLTVDATGTDDAVAKQGAEQATLQHDDLGGVMSITVRSPAEVRHAGTLTLLVPARLVVRIASSQRSFITGTAGVRFENLVGDTEARQIAGTIEGAHRNGDLTIEDADSVVLTLVASQATLRLVRGALSLNARNGATHIDRPQGPVSVDINSQTLVITEPAAAVRASAVAGEIAIARPQAPVDIDARRTQVALDLDRAVPATVFTTDARVDLMLDVALPVTLDIVSESGTIDAAPAGLTADTRNGDSRLAHVFGGDARVAIRGQRSSIVIAARK